MLNDFLALEGARSNELEQFAADPAAFGVSDSPVESLPEPTDVDRKSALAAATMVATALGNRDAAGACKQIDSALEYRTDIPCSEIVEPLADLVPSGFIGPLEMTEAHPGWIKFVAPASDETHQLVLVAQAAVDPYSAERIVTGWGVTNLYTRPKGPTTWLTLRKEADALWEARRACRRARGPRALSQRSSCRTG